MFQKCPNVPPLYSFLDTFELLIMNTHTKRVFHKEIFVLFVFVAF
jgi:hypothetical protein